MKTLIDAVTLEYRGVCALEEAPDGMQFSDLEPPASWWPAIGEVWVSSGGGWVATPDHRGEVWRDPETGDLHEVSTLGNPSAGWVFVQ